MPITPHATIDAIRTLRLERERGKFSTYFPDCTDQCRPRSRKRDDHVGMCRGLYPKHIAWFGAPDRERLMIAANRIGKTQAGAFETTAHLTGLYPHWWTGRRFDEPVECWAVGTNSQTTRDIVQAKLLGSVQIFFF